MTVTPECASTEDLKIDEHIFRAYDIRGVVDENLTEDVAYHLGLSFGTQAHLIGVKRVVVARDGRLTGERLLSFLTKGLVETGMTVINIGMVPTPVLYFACEVLETFTGIMLTGSHNPSNYNGFKMLLDGVPLAEDAIQALHMRMKKQDYIQGQGNIICQDVLDEYIQAVTTRITLKHPMKVVLDCGNGIVGKIAKSLFSRLGAECVELFCEVDGNFPNHHPDPGQPKNLQDLIHHVRESRADLGLAFDGDGDRLGIITNQGEIIWPDRLMMLFVKHVLTALPKSKIIYDVKCSHHLGEYIVSLGGEPVMYKTGHSLIKQKMKELDSPFAGEMSGHFFFKHRWFGFDDACFSGAMLLEILTHDEHQRSLSEIVATLKTGFCTPEINIAVSDKEKFSIIEKLKQMQCFDDGAMITVDGVRVEFNMGWGLVRASNTTPNLVLRFEGNTEQDLKEIQERFKQTLLSIDSNLIFPY